MVLCGVCIGSFSLCVFLDVVTRTIGHPWLWLQQATTAFFAWGVFIGIAVAIRRNDHIYLAEITKRMTGTSRWAIETFNRLVDANPGLGQLRNDRNERLIGVSGYGEYRPVDESGSEDGMRKNRRIELRFIMVSPGSPELRGLIDQIRARRAP